MEFALVILVVAVFVTFALLYDQQERNKSIAYINTIMQEMEAQPEDRSIQMRFLSTVGGGKLPLPMRRMILEKSLGILQGNISDADFQQAFMIFLNRVKWDYDIDEEATYKLLLSMMTVNSAPNVKPFILGIARWHYARKRQDGKLTVYDEQAIQNDIVAHLA